MVEVVQTAEGLPIYHEVFDGNQRWPGFVRQRAGKDN